MDYFEECTGKRDAEIYHSFEIDNKIKIDIFIIQSNIDTNYYSNNSYINSKEMSSKM